MQTDFPTVEIYFVFAFTYCKLRVYKEEENLARMILESHKVEFLTGSESEVWSEVDTRVLLNLTRESLPRIFSKLISQSLNTL